MKSKQFTPQEILDILNGAETWTGTTSEYCRSKGIKEPTFYAWKKKFKGTTSPDGLVKFFVSKWSHRTGKRSPNKMCN